MGAHWCRHCNKSDPRGSPEPGLGARVLFLLHCSCSTVDPRQRSSALAACRLLISVQFTCVRLFVTPWTTASSPCQVIISFSLEGGWVRNTHFYSFLMSEVMGVFLPTPEPVVKHWPLPMTTWSASGLLCPGH